MSSITEGRLEDDAVSSEPDPSERLHSGTESSDAMPTWKVAISVVPIMSEDNFRDGSPAARSALLWKWFRSHLFGMRLSSLPM